MGAPLKKVKVIGGDAHFSIYTGISLEKFRQFKLSYMDGREVDISKVRVFGPAEDGDEIRAPLTRLQSCDPGTYTINPCAWLSGKCGISHLGWRSIIYHTPAPAELTPTSICHMDIIIYCTPERALRVYDTISNSDIAPWAKTIYQYHIVEIACTHNQLWAITDDYQLLRAELSKESPFIKEPTVFLSSVKVRKIACGYEHIAILTLLGQIYTCGGGRGQIGNGGIESTEQPILLKSLAGLTITDITAGGWHSLALSDIGDIYGWGWNESGQVGVQCMKTESGEVGKTDGVNLVAHPVLLFEDTPDVTFTSVSCGARHSAACTDNGILFTWGWNGYHQLGIMEKRLCDVPQPISLPGRVSSVLCGGWSTMVTIDA